MTLYLAVPQAQHSWIGFSVVATGSAMHNDQKIIVIYLQLHCVHYFHFTSLFSTNCWESTFLLFLSHNNAHVHLTASFHTYCTLAYSNIKHTQIDVACMNTTIYKTYILFSNIKSRWQEKRSVHWAYQGKTKQKTDSVDVKMLTEGCAWETQL